MKKLFKTTIVIWSEQNPACLSLSELGQRAEDGDCYCSKSDTQVVNDPDNDSDWDGTEFFEDGSAMDDKETP